MNDLTKKVKKYLKAYAQRDRNACSKLIESFGFPIQHEQILKKHIIDEVSISKLSIIFVQSPESIKAKLREMLFAISLREKNFL